MGVGEIGRRFAVLGMGTLVGLAPALGFGSPQGIGLASAQTAPGSGQSYATPQMQRELDYGTGKSQDSNIFKSADPIDLMNKLRRSTALDDATPPADAVDAALKGFNSPAPLATKPVSAQVKAP